MLHSAFPYCNHPVDIHNCVLYITWSPPLKTLLCSVRPVIGQLESCSRTLQKVGHLDENHPAKGHLVTLVHCPVNELRYQTAKITKRPLVHKPRTYKGASPFLRVAPAHKIGVNLRVCNRDVTYVHFILRLSQQASYSHRALDLFCSLSRLK